MNAIDGTINLPARLSANLNASGKNEKAANAVGSALGTIEDQLIALYSIPEDAKDKKTRLERLGLSQYSSVEGAIGALQIRYQRALRTFEAFTQMMRNAHEMLMSVIRNMRFS